MVVVPDQAMFGIVVEEAAHGNIPVCPLSLLTADDDPGAACGEFEVLLITAGPVELGGC